MKSRQLLDVWFAAFPVWSAAFYAWGFWRMSPLEFKIVSPTFFPPGHPNHVSWPMFLVFGTCVLAVAATAFLLSYLVERRMTPDARRWWWILLILVVPPLGCPLAYFRTGVATATP